MEAVLRDPGLLALQREGGATLARLQQEASRLNANPDVRYAHSISPPSCPIRAQHGVTLRTHRVGLGEQLGHRFPTLWALGITHHLFLHLWPSSAMDRRWRTSPLVSSPHTRTVALSIPGSGPSPSRPVSCVPGKGLVLPTPLLLAGRR